MGTSWECVGRLLCENLFGVGREEISNNHRTGRGKGRRTEDEIMNPFLLFLCYGFYFWQREAV